MRPKIAFQSLRNGEKFCCCGGDENESPVQLLRVRSVQEEKSGKIGKYENSKFETDGWDVEQINGTTGTCVKKTKFEIGASPAALGFKM